MALAASASRVAIRVYGTPVPLQTPLGRVAGRSTISTVSSGVVGGGHGVGLRLIGHGRVGETQAGRESGGLVGRSRRAPYGLRGLMVSLP